jgi:hypothetical protein
VAMRHLRFSFQSMEFYFSNLHFFTLCEKYFLEVNFCG